MVSLGSEMRKAENDNRNRNIYRQAFLARRNTLINDVVRQVSEGVRSGVVGFDSFHATKHAKQIVTGWWKNGKLTVGEANDILKQANTELKRTYPDNGYNAPPSQGPGGVKDKSVDPSEYGDYSTCVSKQVSLGMSTSDASQFCISLKNNNGNSSNNARRKQASLEENQSFLVTRNFLFNGYTPAAAYHEPNRRLDNKIRSASIASITPGEVLERTRNYTFSGPSGRRF